MGVGVGLVVASGVSEGTGSGDVGALGLAVDEMLGSWSGVDILVNPYEGNAYSRGRVLIRAMRDVDVAVRVLGWSISPGDTHLTLTVTNAKD